MSVIIQIYYDTKYTQRYFWTLNLIVSGIESIYCPHSVVFNPMLDTESYRIIFYEAKVCLSCNYLNTPQQEKHITKGTIN